LSASDLRVIPSVYEGLVQYNENSTELVPALAESWSSSDDAQEWTFQLRRGVTFHDGAPFDSEAVKATFEYYQRDLEEGGFLGLLVPEFRRIDTSSRYEITFVLEAPDGDFLRNQTLLRIISPRLAAKGHDAIAREPAGTGAYRVDVVSSRRSTLVANDNYWGDGPYFERLEIPFVGDLNARVNGLVTGQLDIEVRLPPPQVRALDTQMTKLQRKSWGTAYLRFITTNAAVRDVRVRRAIAHAIDRQAIVDNILLGQAELLKSPMPAGAYGYSEPETQYPYDPDRSRALMREAGVGPGHRIRMVAIPSVHVLGPEVAEAMVSQLNAVGFRTDLALLEDAVAGTEAAKEVPRYDVFYGENFWLTGGPIIYTLEFLQGSSHYNPPNVARLVDRMKRLPDGEERLGVIAEVNELMNRGLPVVPLHAHTLTDATRPDIAGYNPTKDGLATIFTSTYRAQ
jgi:peptide/nickel transport system substrate-binding protein